MTRFKDPECWAFLGRKREKDASGELTTTDHQLMLSSSDTRSNVERANNVTVLADKLAKDKTEFSPKDRTKIMTYSGSQIYEYLGAGGLKL